MPGARTFNTYGPNAAEQGLADAAAFNAPARAFGSVPSPVSPQASQSNAIGGNLANINQLYSLATGIGGASGAGAAAGLNAALPGATSALESGLGVANSEVAGQLPPDVIRLLGQQAAERGVSTGTSGSPDSNAAYLQALGLTSLDLSNTGIGNLSRLIGSTPQGPAFNPASMLVNPSEQLGQENFNSMLEAAPDPRAAAMANVAALNAGRGGGGSRLAPPMPDPTITSNPTPSSVYGPLGPFPPAPTGSPATPALTFGNMGGYDANGNAPGSPNYDPTTDPTNPQYQPPSSTAEDYYDSAPSYASNA
jgi:hypothetical protein